MLRPVGLLVGWAVLVVAMIASPGCKNAGGEPPDSAGVADVTASSQVGRPEPEPSPTPPTTTEDKPNEPPAPKPPSDEGSATLANAQPPDAIEPANEGSPDEAPVAAEANTEHTVLILGDSLAATGFGALLERKLDAHPEVACHRKGKSSSGLARPDFFDWIAEGRRQVELRKPELVVVVMGGNDGQDIAKRVKGEQRVPWKHEDWEARYRARMDEFLAEISGDDRRVLWLGLPTMGLRSLEAKLVLIRSIQKEAVSALGDRGFYLDTTPFVADEQGEMLTQAEVGPRGKVQKLRADDRIHFTMAGSEYLADQVLPEVLRQLGVDPG